MGCLKQSRSAAPLKIKFIEQDRKDIKLAEIGDKDLLVEFDEEEVL